MLWAVHTSQAYSYVPLPWGRSRYVNYLEFFWMGDLSIVLHLLIYSTIYLFQYGLMNICFMFGVRIYYFINFVLKLFQFGPLFQLSVYSCSSLKYPHQFFSDRGTALLSDSGRCSRPNLYISRPCLMIRHFSKEHCFTLLKMVLENKTWVPVVLVDTTLSLPLGPLIWQRKEIYMCLLTHLYIHL